jgi:hypothetical protein
MTMSSHYYDDLCGDIGGRVPSSALPAHVMHFVSLRGPTPGPTGVDIMDSISTNLVCLL